MSVEFITRFERVQLLNARVEQLLRGAPPCVPVQEDSGNTPKDSTLNHDASAHAAAIAEDELRQGKLPLILERKLPNGVRELRRITDLRNLW